MLVHMILANKNDISLEIFLDWEFGHLNIINSSVKFYMFEQNSFESRELRIHSNAEKGRFPLNLCSSISTCASLNVLFSPGPKEISRPTLVLHTVGFGMGTQWMAGGRKPQAFPGCGTAFPSNGIQEDRQWVLPWAKLQVLFLTFCPKLHFSVKYREVNVDQEFLL